MCASLGSQESGDDGAVHALSWDAVAVLPNLDLGQAIEGGPACLVPPDDARLLLLRSAQPNLETFLTRFADSHGQEVEPSVLLIQRAPSGDWDRVLPLASFRDLVSAAVVPRTRAETMLNGRNWGGASFADAFDFYPWMLDRHYDGMIATTSGLTGVHQVQDFHGQSSPGIARAFVDGSTWDGTLLERLLQRWKTAIAKTELDWADRALFRSLNMANQASMMPTAASDTTVYDVGRTIILWVSAFEVLFHAGIGGNIDREGVMDALERVEWLTAPCRAPVHPLVRPRKGKPPTAVIPASHLYDRLNAVRNQFAHGNPIAPALLQLAQQGSSLFHVAAPLYRMALTSFLEMKVPEILSMDDPVAFGQAMAERMGFLDDQRLFERALAASVDAGHSPGDEP